MNFFLDLIIGFNWQIGSYLRELRDSNSKIMYGLLICVLLKIKIICFFRVAPFSA